MNVLSVVADVLGILGTIISLVTMILAFSYRKKLVQRSELNNFRAEIDARINNLKSYILVMKDGVFNERILEDVSTEVNAILANYGGVVSESKKSLKKLQNKMEKYYEKCNSEMDFVREDGRRDCIKKLECITADLRKDKESK